MVVWERSGTDRKLTWKLLKGPNAKLLPHLVLSLVFVGVIQLGRHGWDWVKVWILKDAKSHSKCNTIFTAFWRKFESWNPAIAGKVPPIGREDDHFNMPPQFQLNWAEGCTCSEWGTEAGVHLTRPQRPASALLKLWMLGLCSRLSFGGVPHGLVDVENYVPLAENPVLISFTVCCYETSFLYIVGEHSPILLKRSFYTMYTVGENSPMAFTLWCLQSVHLGWKFISDF